MASVVTIFPVLHTVNILPMFNTTILVIILSVRALLLLSPLKFFKPHYCYYFESYGFDYPPME